MSKQKSLIDYKIKYKNLYLLEIESGPTVTFRLLNWEEFQAIRSLLYNFPNMELQVYEYIFDECLIDCTEPGTMIDDRPVVFKETLSAGLVYTVARAIIQLSGPMNAEDLFNNIEEIRNESLMDAETRLFSLISTLLHYTDADLNKMYWPEILQLIGQTELLVQNNIPSAPFRPAETPSNKIDFQKENQSLI